MGTFTKHQAGASARPNRTEACPAIRAAENSRAAGLILADIRSPGRAKTPMGTAIMICRQFCQW